MEKNNSKKSELNENEEEVSKIEEILTEETVESLNEEISSYEEKEENEIDDENNELGEIHQLINGEDNNKKKNNSTQFFKNVLVNILDQAIVLAASGILLLLFDYMIRIIGYMVITPLAVLVIIYFIMNSIYEPIMKKTKLRKTIAKKILNI